jgi:hypothetical protein
MAAPLDLTCRTIPAGNSGGKSPVTQVRTSPSLEYSVCEIDLARVLPDVLGCVEFRARGWRVSVTEGNARSRHGDYTVAVLVALQNAIPQSNDIRVAAAWYLPKSYTDHRRDPCQYDVAETIRADAAFLNHQLAGEM